MKEVRNQGDFPEVLRAGTCFLDKASSRHITEVLVLAQQRPGSGAQEGSAGKDFTCPFLMAAQTHTKLS